MDPLLTIKNELAELVSSSLSELGLTVPVEEVDLNAPNRDDLGDLSTPVILKAAAARGLNPLKLAEKAAKSLEKPDMVKSVRAINGYLNFDFDWAEFGPTVVRSVIQSGSGFGRPDEKQGKLVIEHTSVNPTGPLNIARCRNSMIGDSLARIFDHMKWAVRRLYLLNDVGHQVVVICWGLRKEIRSRDLERRYEEYASKNDFQIFFTYVPAMKRIKESRSAQEEVAELESMTDSDEEVLSQLQETSKKCLKGQMETLNRMGIDFDEITPESRFIEENRLPQIIRRLEKKGVIVQDGEFVGLDLSSMGLQRRKSDHLTLIKEDGSSTYTLRDIAYHEYKFQDGDLFITVLGEDHKREFAELKASLQILGHEEDLRAAFYSFVSYEGGKKMSTRRGDTVPLDQVIDESISRSESEVRKRRSYLSNQEVREIARQVGIGAIKFNILKVDPNKPIEFKWEEAIDFEGDSSAYVQYARARAASILRNAGEYDLEREIVGLSTDEETRLIWSLARTPEVIARTAREMKPNILADHSLELASLFNKFYMKHRVLQVDEPLRSSRIALVESTKQVLTILLSLLGIESPDQI